MNARATTLLVLAFTVVVVGATVQAALAFTITGTVAQKYLVTGSLFSVSTPATFKIKFENQTSGTNLSLCLGTEDDFAGGVCAERINGSGGPGFEFLAIVDSVQLFGKHLYVINNFPDRGTAVFLITIE